MIGFFLRIFAIARITLLEAMRQKVLNILVLFAVIAVSISVFQAQFSFEEQIKSLKDYSFGVMTVFGLFIALISTSYIIPSELENRTIYTILAKPVRRTEFLLGKYLGVVSLLALVTALMSVVFLITLFVQEQMIIADTTTQISKQQISQVDKDQLLDRAIKDIYSRTRTTQVYQSILLVYARLCIVASIAMLISTIASSAIFTVCTTFLIYVIGHMEGYAREVIMDPTERYGSFFKASQGVVSTLIPDMRQFVAIDEMSIGTEVSWVMTIGMLCYTVVYVVLAITMAATLFSEREL
ncbi:MAG: ABC transporter permease [Candidatus Methylacidiphilales bacterium]|nr:ABC transporter permease [Candidatus Methylacidiphilales bacterium]